MDVDDKGDYDDDEGLDDDHELQEALARSRKAKLAKQRQPKVEELRDILSNSEPAAPSTDVNLSDLLPASSSSNEATTSSQLLKEEDSALLSLNMTDEFCRTLGDIPTYGLSGNRAEDDQSSHLLVNRAPVEESSASGAWEEVGIEDTKVDISETQSVPILDEEPDASRGVANALR